MEKPSKKSSGVARESMSESTIDDLIDSFEASAHKDEMGMEFWYARELQELLGYSKWENFESAMNRAQESCKNSGVAVENHWLPDVRKSISGKGREADIVDYKLFRYAYTLPILFALSIILNYGQYTGWIKIENPSEQKRLEQVAFGKGYTQGQRDDMALKLSDLGE